MQKNELQNKQERNNQETYAKTPVEVVSLYQRSKKKIEHFLDSATV